MSGHKNLGSESMTSNHILYNTKRNDLILLGLAAVQDVQELVFGHLPREFEEERGRQRRYTPVRGELPMAGPRKTCSKQALKALKVRLASL